jgi:hypothetical protein
MTDRPVVGRPRLAVWRDRAGIWLVPAIVAV